MTHETPYAPRGTVPGMHSSLDKRPEKCGNFERNTSRGLLPGLTVLYACPAEPTVTSEMTYVIRGTVPGMQYPLTYD